MFPDTLKLPMLTLLDLAYTMPWWPSDLDRLVSSCSTLQALSLCCSEELQLTPLLQLTALTSLWLAGATEDITVASLVQLSALHGLQELIVTDPCWIDDDEVRSLTALTQLTSLGLSDSGGVYSAAMQQQLLQWFGQYEVEGVWQTCHIIMNTVGTSLLFLVCCPTRQQWPVLSYSARLHCMHMLWSTLVFAPCAGLHMRSISPQCLYQQPQWRWCSP